MNVKSILLGAGAFGLSASAMAGITGFNDIAFWVGSGANEAALVLDFHDGELKESFAWGYRWDGVASGAQMISDVAAADANLTLDHGGVVASGFYMKSISYSDGLANHFAASGNFNTHPDDFSSWGYYLNGGTAGDTAPYVAGGDPVAMPGGGTALPLTWTSSPAGSALDSFGDLGRVLADGSWDAWSFGLNNESYTHTALPGMDVAAAAVPEPSSVILLVGGFGGLAWFRRRRKYFFHS